MELRSGRGAVTGTQESQNRPGLIREKIIYHLSTVCKRKPVIHIMYASYVYNRNWRAGLDRYALKVSKTKSYRVVFLVFFGSPFWLF